MRTANTHIDLYQPVNARSDSEHYPFEISCSIHSVCKRATKAQIRLCECAGWSGLSLPAYVIIPLFHVGSQIYSLFTIYAYYCMQAFHGGELLTLVLLNQDIPCLCKQRRSRSVGFFRSQLIWICTVCHSLCDFISTIWIKGSDWQLEVDVVSWFQSDKG